MAVTSLLGHIIFWTLSFGRSSHLDLGENLVPQGTSSSHCCLWFSMFPMNIATCLAPALLDPFGTNPFVDVFLEN